MYNVPIEKRLWEKVIKHPDGCWEWTGYLDKGGYGRIKWKGKIGMVHRIAYTLLVGPIPEGLTIDHTCHNGSGCTSGRSCPHRRCVNPAHLEAVSMRTNVLRGNTFTAANAAKTHCDRGHELAGENLLRTSAGGRSCRECSRASGRKYSKTEKFRKRHAAYERMRRKQAREKREQEAALEHGPRIRAVVEHMTNKGEA